MNLRTRYAIIVPALLAVGCCLAIPCVAAAQLGGPKILRQQNLPIVITAPGSYRLATNLTVSSPSMTAIFVKADDVTIDLDGFTIQGPQVGAVGNGSGVNTDVRNNVVVRNGVVRGFFDAAAACVSLPGGNNRVENLRVVDCPQLAIFVGPGGVVRDCQVMSSVSGIHAGTGSMITGNTVVNSASHAFGVFAPYKGVSIVGNSCQGSGDTCVLIRADGNRIEGNTITSNSAGLDLTGGTGNFYARNFLHGNGTAVLGGADDVDGAAIDLGLSNVIVP